MTLPKLTESIIRAASIPQSFERGQEYYQGGAILNTTIQNNLLMGDCEGTQEPYYHVQVELDEAGICFRVDKYQVDFVSHVLFNFYSYRFNNEVVRKGFIA